MKSVVQFQTTTFSSVNGHYNKAQVKATRDPQGKITGEVERDTDGAVKRRKFRKTPFRTFATAVQQLFSGKTRKAGHAKRRRTSRQKA